MKKSLIALAALGAFAGAASAQSSVTLFGIVDVGARAVKNGDGGTAKTLTNDGLATSRIGFRGEEDLGAGLKASFWLEAGLGVDTGTGGNNQSTNSVTTTKFFGRRSTVSLSGPFGEVRAGRDYVPTFSNLSAFDIYGAVGVGNILNLINAAGSVGGANAGFIGALGSGAGTLVRADNTISYFLPSNIGGVYGTIQAAAAEGQSAGTASTNAGSATNGNNRYVGGRIGFASGPIDVAGAYGRTRIPGNDDLRVWNVGGSFTLPVVKVTALYHRADYQPSGLDNRSQKLWAIGASVPIGQAEIRATYQRSDIGGGASGLVGLRNEDDARQYAVGAIYNLSKRTAVYADVGRLQNRGGSTLTIPGGTTTTGDFNLGGRNSTALALGVRHSF